MNNETRMQLMLDKYYDVCGTVHHDAGKKMDVGFLFLSFKDVNWIDFSMSYVNELDVLNVNFKFEGGIIVMASVSFSDRVHYLLPGEILYTTYNSDSSYRLTGQCNMRIFWEDIKKRLNLRDYEETESI